MSVTTTVTAPSFFIPRPPEPPPPTPLTTPFLPPPPAPTRVALDVGDDHGDGALHRRPLGAPRHEVEGALELRPPALLVAQREADVQSENEQQEPADHRQRGDDLDYGRVEAVGLVDALPIKEAVGGDLGRLAHEVALDAATHGVVVVAGGWGGGGGGGQEHPTKKVLGIGQEVRGKRVCGMRARGATPVAGARPRKSWERGCAVSSAPAAIAAVNNAINRGITRGVTRGVTASLTWGRSSSGSTAAPAPAAGSHTATRPRRACGAGLWGSCGGAMAGAEGPRGVGPAPLWEPPCRRAPALRRRLARRRAPGARPNKRPILPALPDCPHPDCVTRSMLA
jgi:hypothetical protein